MKSNEFNDLKSCLEYIYKNFGKEVFFSGRLSAYVKDLGPSIEESSVIRILERDTNLTQIESIESMDIDDRNFLVNDIIYKLPNHLNKDAFRSTLEIVILSMGVDLEEKKIQIQENSPISSNTNDFKIMAIEDYRDEDNNNVQKDLIIYQDDEGQTPANPPSDFEFDRSTGTIVRYLGQRKNVRIPEKIDGVQVKKIGDYSFAYMSVEDFELCKKRGDLCDGAFYNHYIRIENVVIPQGVETIGDFAFYTNMLEFLKLPSSIKSIGSSAFFGNQIIELTLGESLEDIEKCAFMFNFIETLNIPASVKSIGKSAFLDNQIKELILGEGLESIGDSAFRDNKIETFNIPASIKSIGDFAFFENQIKEIYLPHGIEYVDEIAFDDDVVIHRR